MSNKAKLTAVKVTSKPVLVPKLRFPEFRDEAGWDTTPGNELFQQINNRRATAGLPILAITQEYGAIPRNLIDYHVSVTDKSVETYKEVRHGDFIISLRSFQGGIEYSEYHGICSPAYVILRKRTELSDLFFRQYFKSYSFIQQLTKNLEGLRDGKMVSYKQFSELLLPNPMPLEQQKIAEFLRSVDVLIAAQDQKLDTLKTHKKGLMQQLFPLEGETRPRLRFPEFQNDVEWEPTTLEQIVDFKSGGTPSKGNPTFWNGSIPWASAKDMKQLFLDDTEDHITAAAVDGGAKSVPVGTILMLTRGMTLLKDVPICIVNRQMSFNQDVKALQPKAHFDGRFLLYLLLGCKQRLLNLVDIAGHGTGRLDTEKLKMLDVMLPYLAEQQRIADCLSSLEELITSQCRKIDALKIYKKGLMQQLFPSPAEVEA